MPPPPGVGDGGASWRMKALKRAQEQASREGRKLDEVCSRFCDEVLKPILDVTYGANQHYLFFISVVTIRLIEIHYACLLLTLSEHELGDVELSRLSRSDGGR